MKQENPAQYLTLLWRVDREKSDKLATRTMNAIDAVLQSLEPCTFAEVSETIGDMSVEEGFDSDRVYLRMLGGKDELLSWAARLHEEIKPLCDQSAADIAEWFYLFERDIAQMLGVESECEKQENEWLDSGKLLPE